MKAEVCVASVCSALTVVMEVCPLVISNAASTSEADQSCEDDKATASISCVQETVSDGEGVLAASASAEF